MNFLALSTITLATVLYFIQHGVLSLSHYTDSLVNLCFAGFNILMYIIVPNRLTAIMIAVSLGLAIYAMP